MIVPQTPGPPLAIIEFQFGENPQIYTRIVQKTAAVQEEFHMREVQDVIFFAEQRLDYRTKPRAGQVLLECRSDSGRAWTVITGEDQALRLELSDGRHPFEHWSTDTGLLGAGRRHQVTWIVDGNANRFPAPCNRCRSTLCTDHSIPRSFSNGK